jgi:hypothetical protein
MPNEIIPLEELAYRYFHRQVTVLSAVFERCNLNAYMLNAVGQRVDKWCRASPNDGKSHEWFAALEYFRGARIRFLFPWKDRHGLIAPVSVSSDRPAKENDIAFLCYELIEQMKPYAYEGGTPKPTPT